MSKDYHPCIDTSFLVQSIEESGKVIPDSKLQAGSSISFVLKGKKAFHKKFLTFREIDGCVSFEQAMGKAMLCNFIGKLMDWCEKNKGWKEGEYVVDKKTNKK